MSTLGAALQRAARIHGDRRAIVDEGLSFSWREHVERVACLAGHLLGQGLQPNQRFGILAPNSWRQAELLHAGYWAGLTPVPLNSRLAPPELDAILRSADCQQLMVAPAFLPLFESPPLRAWQGRVRSFEATQHDAKLAAACAAPLAQRRPEDEALLLYTGGTSGLPKGVPLQHRHILANAMQVGLAWPPQPADLCLHVAPMFHSADLVMGCFTLQGAAHAYLPRFTPELLLQTIEKLRVTAVMMVPTMLLMVLDSGLLPRFDVSSLKRVLYGASPMSLEAITRVAAALPGVAFTQGYGLTETGPLLAMLDGDAHAQGLRGEQAQRLHSCGQPLAGVELKIVQADGQELPCGESGEIVVRGPNVVAAYLHAAPTAGADTPAQPGGDWFSTGDVGRQDSDGFLYVLDRKKDMIISGGENVYSAEVEAVLSAHPDVAEVAVIGVPDPLYGEAVLAVLVSRCAVRPDAQQLREFCLQRIGAYKVPRRFEFVDALPRSAMGKVLKTVLRMTWAAA